MLSGSDKSYVLTLADFTKAQRPLRLDAFEHYIRGLLANEDDPRLRELREAARLEPTWPDPDFALGETYRSRNDCGSALPWFAHVPKTHDRYVEALFATGVCRLELNQPERAEEVFTSLQQILRSNVGDRSQMVSNADLPEILNNLGIARARQGKRAAAQADLVRATEIDPDQDDYPFNLGLLALSANDVAGAIQYFREASEREPDNGEDRAFLIQALEKAGKKDEADREREAAAETLGGTALPANRGDAKDDALSRLGRIKPELDVAALRLEIAPPEPPGSSGMTTGAGVTPAWHLRRGNQELSTGRLDSAENEYRAALGAEPNNAAAHRGLAEVARRSGKLDDAVKELQASLAARDSAVVRTTLAKVYVEGKKPDLALVEVERALKLAPNYAEAKQLLERLQRSKPSGGSR
jgi:tetratricopeptide (TPR) repeat protein